MGEYDGLIKSLRIVGHERQTTSPNTGRGEAILTPDFVIKSSYGNDSCALIQWCHEQSLENVVVLYNDTGWSRPGWIDRVSALEEWVRSLGFSTYRTYSIGMESLVRKKKSWPRQGMQFCTQELKIKPTIEWLKEHDPNCESVFVVGVRRCESKNRNYFPMFSSFDDGQSRWAPLVNYNDDARNMLLMRAGIDPLPHRSDECWTCINANRNDILRLSKDEQTIDKIANIESSMGFTAKGAPRTMYRPYRHQGAVGIREIVEWAKSPNGQYTFDLDDGNGTSGCEAGWCRS